MTVATGTRVGIGVAIGLGRGVALVTGSGVDVITTAGVGWAGAGIEVCVGKGVYVG